MAKKPNRSGDSPVAPDSPAAPYLVLARKYRPASFATLIGQDAMVQTLTNAFKTGRIAHAFMLTGVRGVGKTTTARILARALNYADEKGAHPTLDLSKEGIHCRAIIESRHVDVVEMDAASHTGIDDIREINDSTRYGPVSAPYKVFIIDEVHMLSKSAFNGLLKTLEEPPPYVKFIFATTEIRKVPVTILSRCQRFDLRRVPADIMRPYLSGILEKEKIEIEPDALSLIVRAGEGSVRDCLSLLDQAIAHAGGKVEAANVRLMLGLADRARSIDLFETLMGGQVEPALKILREQVDAGADPATVIADLANLTHLVTRLKVVPSAAQDPSLTPDERDRGSALAGKLGLRVLSRAWQVLLKGHEEANTAPDALAAAEMILIRLAHAADLPTPDEIIEKLQNAPAPSNGGTRSLPSSTPRGGYGQAAPRLAPAPGDARPAPANDRPPELRAFTDIVAMAGQQRDLILKHALESQLSPVSMEPGRLEVALAPGADPQIIQTLAGRLRTWTGRPWMVTVSSQAAPATLREQRAAAETARLDAAHEDPMVQKVLSTFPGSKIVAVRRRGEAGLGDEAAPEPEMEMPNPEDEEDFT